MSKIAPIIAMYAAKYPEHRLAETACLSYQTATTAARTVLVGRLNPFTPDPDPAVGREAFSRALVARYGFGFGVPWRADPSVLPAISLVPDAEANNYGWLEEENFEAPSEETLRQMGWPGGPLAAADLLDLKACHNFTQSVVRAMNRGLPVGSPLAAPQQQPSAPAALPGLPPGLDLAALIALLSQLGLVKPAAPPAPPSPPAPPVTPPVPVAPPPAPKPPRLPAGGRQTFTATSERPLLAVPLSFSGTFSISGEIRPPAEVQPAETSITLFSLGTNVTAEQARNVLPRKWLVLELFARNGKLKLGLDGHGGRKAVVPTLDLGVSARSPVTFDLDFDGEEVHLLVNGKTFTSKTFLGIEDGKPAFLLLGAPGDIDNQPPYGWTLEYTLA